MKIAAEIAARAARVATIVVLAADPVDVKAVAKAVPDMKDGTKGGQVVVAAGVLSMGSRKSNWRS
ncbi:MAG TPA: hypothetical protein VE958_10245 [Bryobacteraceae bacterium]|nr:hypothetical protein [Bryobacteraceae bacterium]